MKAVLITGGTGFLGQAIVRRLLKRIEGGPERICIYSRNEAAQARMRAELGDPEHCRWFIGDVRDQHRLRRAMESVTHVIHAAALKRVEVGEYNPTEMVATNVGGALAVINAAIDAGVKKVVAVSTDKACEPLNCYGATKLVAEKLFLGANNAIAGAGGPRFAVVRYGNVAGSTGSVIPTWRSLLEAGKPIRITQANATRFWMTADQAVDLVLNVLEFTLGGEIVVPDLPAYEVSDLAAAMDPNLPILPRNQGLGLGEKLHETLISVHEAQQFERVGDYWIHTPGPKKEPREGAMSSGNARRMPVDQIREELAKI